MLIPDDLESCQQLLRELFEAHRRLQEVYEELLATCTSMQDSQLKLEQEKETLEQSIKELTHRLYGRRSERSKVSPDQLPLDFGDSDPIEVVPDVTEDEEFVEEQKKKRRRRRRKKPGGRFPDHIERRTERIEPDLPEGIVPEDCQLIGVDVVEIMEFDRPQLWIRRLEYPKYRIPDQPQQGVVQGAREVNLMMSGRRAIRNTYARSVKTRENAGLKTGVTAGRSGELQWRNLEVGDSGMVRFRDVQVSLLSLDKIWRHPLIGTTLQARPIAAPPIVRSNGTRQDVTFRSPSTVPGIARG